MKKTASILALTAILLSLTACNGDVGTGSSLPDVHIPQTDNSSKNSSDNSVGNSSSVATVVNDSSDNSSGSSNDSSVSDNSSQESSDTTSSNNNSSGKNDHDGEMSGSGVFVLDDGRALELYGGGYSRGKNYAETVNQLKQMVGEVNVFSLVAPKAVSFYLPEKYSYLTASEYDNIDYLNGFLDDYVYPVDAYTALSEHVNEDIYFRTDHHWQPLGAYYAAEEFAKTAQVPFAPLSAYETVALEGYVGTMYGWSNENPEVKKHPDVFTYYKPKNDYTVTYYSQSLTDPFEGSLFLRSLDTVPTVSWYLVFMGGDDKVAHIHTDVTNGRKLVMVKDSYGNAFVPCLTNSFEDIWVVDMRHFEGSISQLVKDEGLTDVLFCMCSMSATGDNQYKLADKL